MPDIFERLFREICQRDKWIDFEKPLLEDMMEELRKLKSKNLYHPRVSNGLLNRAYLDTLAAKKREILEKVRLKEGPSVKLARIWPELIADLLKEQEYTERVSNIFNDNRNLRRLVRLSPKELEEEKFLISIIDEPLDEESFNEYLNLKDKYFPYDGFEITTKLEMALIKNRELYAELQKKIKQNELKHNSLAAKLESARQKEKTVSGEEKSEYVNQEPQL
ncbi:MAG TPA: hypothetical protein GX687_06455 [Clostridia bacterium]|nr:hypothetical protein [Clostridia bacterium]